MSGEFKCQKCGELLQNCKCKPDRIEPDKVIRIEHKFQKSKGFDESIDKGIQEQLIEEKRKRLDYEKVIALQAEKSFQDEKNAVLEQYPEDKRDEIEDLIGDNPDVLEDVKRDLLLHGSQVPVRRHRPSGKAVLRDVDSNIETINQEDEFRSYVDKLYKKARLSRDPIEKVEAEREISKLFNSYEQGMSEFKDRKVKFVVTQCLSCGSVITGSDAQRFVARKIPCPFCNYKGGLVRESQHLERY